MGIIDRYYSLFRKIIHNSDLIFRVSVLPARLKIPTNGEFRLCLTHKLKDLQNSIQIAVSGLPCSLGDLNDEEIDLWIFLLYRLYGEILAGMAEGCSECHYAGNKQ